MKKRLASVLILSFIITSSAAAQNWFKGTVDEAIAQSKKEGKMVLLDFFSGG
jgi:peptidoglycan hydrolase CwlO-like protein